MEILGVVILILVIGALCILDANNALKAFIRERKAKETGLNSPAKTTNEKNSRQDRH